MPTLKLIEPWAVTYKRNMVKDSLMWHGEQAVLLRLYHPEIDRDIQRCPRCSYDEYRSGEEMCPVCYGTNMWDGTTQTGGVKEAHRAWALFTDREVTESHTNQGLVTPDVRQCQAEAFPMLMQNDVIVRVKCWDPLTHTALSEGEFYRVKAVTRNSLRTGANFGQTQDDVIGQSFEVAKLPEDSVGICQYPIQNVVFDEFQIIGSQQPIAVGQPDDNIIYIPVPSSPPQPNYGYVGGAELEWNPVFTFVQQAPANPWIINHTLDHYPNVNVTVLVNGVETQVDANITYPSPTVVNITFYGPQSGSAQLT
jgi:hypothetical protein